MVKRIGLVFLVGVALLMVSACSRLITPGSSLAQNSGLETSVAATIWAQITRQADASVESTATASETPKPSEMLPPSETPTSTLTPTPEIPVIEVSTGTNCRSGPGTDYLILGAMKEGDVAEVVGRIADADYLVIANPERAGSCWLWTRFASVSGSLEGLAFFDTPPTPTPSLTPTPSVIWADTWQIWVGPAPLTLYSMTLSHSGSTINGSFVVGAGNVVTVNGTLSADYTYAAGTWSSTAGSSGAFEWQRKKNINQFIGNIDGGSTDWCGARLGASQPSPCFGP